MRNKWFRTTAKCFWHQNPYFYQKALKRIFLESFKGKLKWKLFLRIFLKGKPNLKEIWFIKKKARPGRTFLNSNRTVPPRTLVNQPISFPLPFPMREPSVFFVRGRWGKTLNHIKRRVLSFFRAPRRTNALNFESCFAVRRRGLKIKKPQFP